MMSSNGQKSKKIRPICKFCDHKPFRYESGLDWHLKNIHPVEYAAMTNRPAFVYVDGTTPHPDEDLGPVHMRQELDLTPTEKPPTPPPIQPLRADHDPLECEHEGCDGRGNARLLRIIQAHLGDLTL